MESKDGVFTGTINGKEALGATNGVTVVTDLRGHVLEIIGIDAVPVDVDMTVEEHGYRFTIKPNEVYAIDVNRVFSM
ncbi:hypothetical protein SAMN05216312_104551 [Cohnella sp. OV330]|uniref:hypothetical protein n=1 Tax=Cohnella sp. OV330 TaxID=1855288 RepID=UPI0008F0DE22|nr:hypothetical protein [Cohnella sp. OV330]SFB22321.1 hypothetical protein SAMN05216312_104551 [Cohnella sp. OV330]